MTSNLPSRVRIFLFAALISVSACTGSRRAAPVAGPSSGDASGVRALYDAAISDAAVVEPNEIFPLLPIRTDSVLVVTWTRSAEAFPDTLARETWVTVVPEVRIRCRSYKAPELNLRVHQVLGLPPERSDRTFVEFVAARKDLFRPCTDPDPTTDRCSTEFPSSSAHAHVRWLADQMLFSYRIPGGYPWTRLGYTLDWNAGTPDYGASEYVVRKGAVVRVTQKLSTEAYCAGP